MQPPRRTAVFSSLAAVLILAFVFQTYSASRLKSPTMDEPAHIAAGLSYVQTGIFRVNRQHPPLLKELAGLSLVFGGARWPRTAEASEVLKGNVSAETERDFDSAMIADSGADGVMFRSRLPFIVISALGGLLLYLFGRDIVGEAAALGALFLYALDPTIVAHSYLVTTDVGLAVFSILFLWALWKYLWRPHWARLLIAGVTLGLALCTKFSAVLLIPTGGLLVLAALRWPVEKRNESGLKSASTGRPDGGWIRRIAARAGSFGLMCVAALLLIDLVYFSRRGLSLYISGMHQLNADHNPNYIVFMAGQLAHKFYSYLAVCYLVKEPMAGIALFVIGLYELWRAKMLPMGNRIFLLLPPAALFAGYTIGSDNLGIRYIIPVLPFLYLVAGLGLEFLLKNGSATIRWAAVLLCAWVILAAAGIYPDHLSYFNEAACLIQGRPREIGIDGGTACGPLWLADSNVDWGQGLKQLKSWLGKNAQGRSFQFGYFGSYQPDAYGISYQYLNIPDLMSPKPGLYVVSAHILAFLPAMGAVKRQGYGQWLRDVPPSAVIGHSLYVFDVTAIPASASTVAPPQDGASRSLPLGH
jgi:hypothetical protein